MYYLSHKNKHCESHERHELVLCYSKARLILYKYKVNLLKFKQIACISF